MNMSYLLPFFMAPVAIAVLVLVVIGWRKETEICQKYYGVFGRWKAFFFMLCAQSVFSVLLGIIMLMWLSSNGGEVNFKTIFNVNDVFRAMMITAIVAMLVLWMIANLIWWSAKRKCPEHLKKGLMGQMLLVGLGRAGKLTVTMMLIILPFLWIGLWQGVGSQFAESTVVREEVEIIED